MKSLRERMNSTLSLNLDKKNKTKVNPCTMNDSNKRIRETSETTFHAQYRLGNEVMESSHAGMQVLWGKRMKDGMDVVVKVRSRANSFKRASEEREWRATTEVQLSMPPTATICQFIDVVATKQNYYVVMEKVEGRDLFEHMDEESVKQCDAREVIYQILDALKFLHRQGRIHKDLKLENVMVDMNAQKFFEDFPSEGSIGSPLSRSVSPGGRNSKDTSEANLPGVKLIDFDTVENWQPSNKAQNVLGSNGYIAPESYLGEYSPASDVFCAGVIMYKMLTRHFPFPLDMFDDRPGENYVGSSAMRRIHERLKNSQVDFSRFPLDRCPEAADLCSKMLQLDPKQRPSAEEALNHIWFNLLHEELDPQLSTVGQRSTPAPSFQFPASSVGLPNRN